MIIRFPDDRAMNTEMLRSFVEVARQGSYVRAARALRLSQPTAFRHVQQLEETLATELVFGAGKTVVLTNRGKAVLEQAIRVLEEVDRLRHSTVRESDDLATGALDLAVGTTLAASIMPVALVALAERYPGIRVRMTVLNDRAAIDDAVLQHGYDAGFRSGAGSLPGLKLSPVLGDSLVFVAPRNHALASRPAIGPGDLKGLPFVGHTSAAAPDLCSQLDAWALAGGTVLESRLAFDDQDAIVTAVLAGGGVSIVSNVIAHRPTLTRNLAVRPLVPALSRDFYLVRRRRSRALKALDLLTGIMSALVPGDPN
jgi:DNA-binding transcriptional LysR family regulator